MYCYTSSEAGADAAAAAGMACDNGDGDDSGCEDDVMGTGAAMCGGGAGASEDNDTGCDDEEDED